MPLRPTRAPRTRPLQPLPHTSRPHAQAGAGAPHSSSEAVVHSPSLAGAEPVRALSTNNQPFTTFPPHPPHGAAHARARPGRGRRGAQQGRAGGALPHHLHGRLPGAARRRLRHPRQVRRAAPRRAAPRRAAPRRAALRCAAHSHLLRCSKGGGAGAGARDRWLPARAHSVLAKCAALLRCAAPCFRLVVVGALVRGAGQMASCGRSRHPRQVRCAAHMLLLGCDWRLGQERAAGGFALARAAPWHNLGMGLHAFGRSGSVWWKVG